jgi:hypothetical protein
LFALATVSSGGAEFVRGIVGYGTVVSAPLAGIGAWTFGEALFERSPHPIRALVLAAFVALLAVVAFFALAAAFNFDGSAWMILYSLSPPTGAALGYYVGAGTVSLNVGPSEG